MYQIFEPILCWLNWLQYIYNSDVENKELLFFHVGANNLIFQYGDNLFSSSRRVSLLLDS